jgi:5-methylthioadenosine/S-adenosylhomocysteine deaminase
MGGKIIIKGGCVLSMDKSVGNHTIADVLVEDGRISEVGTGLRARGAEQIDATDTIVMPGFVDTHRHAWQTLFRNLGRGGIGEHHVGPSIYGPHYRPDDVYAATLLGLVGAIEAGITTIVDWSDIQVDPSFTDAVLSAHADSGARTVFVHAAPSWVADGANKPSRLDGLADGDSHQMATFAYGPADPTGMDLDLVATDWGEALQRHLRIHVHVGRDASDRGIVAALAERDLLSPDLTLVHCTNLGEEDLDAIASSGATVSLTPANEMAAGYGAPPLQAFIDRGIRPGLGVGNEVEAPGDLFAQMRAANAMQHATLFDLKLSGKAGIPNLLSTRDVIRYGTIDGATAVGLADVTGSLTPGKRADMVVLRSDRPNISPVNDPIGAVVWGMDTSNIDWVIVGGDPVVREGALTTDAERIRDLANAARHRVASAAGLLASAGGAS